MPRYLNYTIPNLVRLLVVSSSWVAVGMVGCGDDRPSPDNGNPPAIDAANLADAAEIPDAAGSSDGTDGCGVNPDQAPEVGIVFPPPSALTDATSITIRGTATHGDTIDWVRIDGVPVQTSNGHADWQATVSLSPGVNVFTLESADTLGNHDCEAARVTIVQASTTSRIGSGPSLSTPSGIAYDASTGRLFVGRSGSPALISVDPATGARTIISDDTIGNGPAAGVLHGMAVDAPGNRVIAMDRPGDFARVLAIDLASGDRTLISDGGDGSGQDLQAAYYLAHDPARNQILTARHTYASDFESSIGTFVAVDLNGGARTVLSSDIVGSGPTVYGPFQMALDESNNRVLVASLYDYLDDFAASGLFAIDLISGDRTKISDATLGSGPPPETMTGVALDAQRNRAIVVYASWHLGRIAAIDLATGDRTLISGAGTGTGPAMLRIFHVALPNSEYALVVDIEHSAVLAVDLVTGDRVIVSR